MTSSRSKSSPEARLAAECFAWAKSPLEPPDERGGDEVEGRPIPAARFEAVR